MKKYKILSAAIAVAVLGGANAMAQFNFQNGDMVIGLGNGVSTSPGVFYDVLVDLGSISQFQNTSASPFSYNLSSVLNAVDGGVSSQLYWGVFGENDSFANPGVSQSDPNTVWTTLKRTNPANRTNRPHVDNATFAGATVGDMESIGNFTQPGQANPGIIVDYGSAPNPTVEVDSSQSPFSQLMTDPNSGNFGGDWAYNILNSGAGTSDLYQSDPGDITGRGVYLGNFNLSSGGLLTFTPVPEPSTWLMLGSGALTLLALRRRK
jgi:hypothetical protein